MPYSAEPRFIQSSLTRLLSVQLFLVTVLFLLGEIVLRFAGYGNPLLYIAPPEIGYLISPNQSIQRPGGLVRINQYGMRSDDVPDIKEKGAYRILLIGDSTLYGGSYLDQTEIYSERLKEILNKNFRTF